MSKKKKQKQAPFPPLLKGALVALIILGLGGSLYFFLSSDDQPPPIAYTEHLPSLPPPIKSVPKATAPSLAAPPTKPILPHIAIIIDDIGHQKRLALDLLKLDLNLSFSVLPDSPFAPLLAKKIAAADRDLLLHLPMEPTDSKWDPGSGALLLSMSQQAISNTLAQDLTGYPFIGINNHMGSKFTANQQAMLSLLTAVGSRGLFYVDSLTSSQSVGYETARVLGVKTAKRDIFLDNEQTPMAIERQLHKLIALAEKHGQAIGIGHPYPATLAALRANTKTINRQVQLVGVHSLVH